MPARPIAAARLKPKAHKAVDSALSKKLKGSRALPLNPEVALLMEWFVLNDTAGLVM
jgi:hypothetical protein